MRDAQLACVAAVSECINATLMCRGTHSETVLHNIAHLICASDCYSTICEQGFAALRKGHATPLCINFATQVAAMFITEPAKTDSLLVVVYTLASSDSTSATESNGPLQETALLMPVRSSAAASILGTMPAWKVSLMFNMLFSSHTSLLSSVDAHFTMRNLLLILIRQCS
jgi:hypothetical protein